MNPIPEEIATVRETPRGSGEASSMKLTGDSVETTAFITNGAAKAAPTSAARADRRVLGALGLAAVSLAGAGVLWRGQARGGTHDVLVVSLVGLSLLAAVHAVRVHRGVAGAASRTAIAVAATAATLIAVAYVGPLSMAAVPLPMLVFYFGQDDDRQRARLIYAMSALGTLLIAILGLLGVIRLTEALFAMQIENHRALINLTLFSEIVLGATFALASEFQRGSAQALREIQEANRELLTQEARLAEAREEAARARTGALGLYSGQRVGTFQAGRVLGRGGMGEVYAAVEESTGRPVALKVLHEHLQNDLEAVRRFFREARICSGLSSPHLVRVYETGLSSDGAPFLAMEHLQGMDLSQTLRERGQLPLDAVCRLVSETAAALQVAHGANIVHRDLKTQNIFAEETDGRITWKVLDFGVSRVTDATATLTHGKVVGTPAYMAPEQARGATVEARADQYSLAVVAFRALTGRLPFPGPDMVAIIERVLTELPPPASAFVDVSRDVDAVLAVGMAKNPEERFESVATFAEAFSAAAAGRLPAEIRRRGEVMLRGAGRGAGSARPEPGAAAMPLHDATTG